MPSRPTPSSAGFVRESSATPLGILVHDVWAKAFPWVIQGTTTAGRGERPFDLGLFSEGSSGAEVRRSWKALTVELGVDTVVHAHQPHGGDVRIWPTDERDQGRGGGLGGSVPVLVEACDGHITDRPGVLLAVTVADCVPAFIVDARCRTVAMVHAGWRGAAVGILEEAISRMAQGFQSRPDDLHVHFGPAICGLCYEVGPEVHEALDQPVPAGPEPIDLRAILGARAAAAGVEPGRISTSTHCTLCGEVGLFSHRGGDAQRQVGFLGIRS